MPDAPNTPVVFLYGALRSGTTMLRLMLKAHQGISNPGEADFLFDYIGRDPTHPTGWRYDRDALSFDRIFRTRQLSVPEGVDGLDLMEEMLTQLAARGSGLLTLSVHRHAERIAATRPDARFVHLVRDPRDVARSVVGMGWAGTLYRGVDFWVRSETAWNRIAERLKPGQALQLNYESLLDDVEGSLRNICDFLGVPFSPAMLDYHETSTYGPPDASHAEQWRRVSSPREIALVEGKAGALMRERGYVPTGAGHNPGLTERVGLYLLDRAFVLQFAIRRYGAITVVSGKLSKRLGLTGWNRRVRERMQEITLRTLK